MSARLGRQNWIDEGLRTLRRSGIESVRVETLAKALKVTKGSFYWHFKDRQALLAALLEDWLARATMAVIEEVETGGGDAGARLRRLFTIVSGADGRLERAMRNWAAADALAGAAVAAVDRQRLGYLDGLFKELGFDAAGALARARLCHEAVIGQFAARAALPAEERIRERVDVILPMLLAR